MADASAETIKRLIENSERGLEKAERFLEEKNLHIPEECEKMESLTLMRMETLFLRYDVACSIWGYLNAE